MKNKKLLGLISIMFITIVIVVIIVIIIANNNKEQTKKLTLEEIQEIEKQYLDSENLLNIETKSKLSDKGSLASGTIKSGTLSENDIVNYIDIYGNLRWARISSIEKFRSVERTLNINDNGALLLQGVELDNIEFSNIIFKQSEYNGIYVSFIGTKSNIKQLEEFSNKNDDFEITINNKNVSAKLVSFDTEYTSESFNTINISLIINNEEKYDISSEVKIDKFNLTGRIELILK